MRAIAFAIIMAALTVAFDYGHFKVRIRSNRLVLYR
jgi:hypothetical protein